MCLQNHRDLFDSFVWRLSSCCSIILLRFSSPRRRSELPIDRHGQGKNPSAGMSGIDRNGCRFGDASGRPASLTEHLQLSLRIAPHKKHWQAACSVTQDPVLTRVQLHATSAVTVDLYFERAPVGGGADMSSFAHEFMRRSKLDSASIRARSRLGGLLSASPRRQEPIPFGSHSPRCRNHSGVPKCGPPAGPIPGTVSRRRPSLVARVISRGVIPCPRRTSTFDCWRWLQSLQ